LSLKATICLLNNIEYGYGERLDRPVIFLVQAHHLWLASVDLKAQGTMLETTIKISRPS